MAEDNSLDDVLNYVDKLLKDIKKNKEKFLNYEVTDEVEKKLEQLEKDVDEFAMQTEEILRQAGMSEKDMRQALWKIAEDLPEEQKAWLLKARRLREDIKDTQTDFQGEAGPAEPPVREEPDDSAKKKSNKSKFKRLGGDHWKPL